jgi:hypothetical protein
LVIGGESRNGGGGVEALRKKGARGRKAMKEESGKISFPLLVRKTKVIKGDLRLGHRVSLRLS